MVADDVTAGGVGSRLRGVRQQLGLALGDLPGLTGGAFTAAAVGSYEREFRSPTDERLDALCGYYNVPLAEVLTGLLAPAAQRSESDMPGAGDDAGTAQETRALRRFAALVAARRTGPTRHTVATGMPRLRRGDLEVLAVVLDTSAARLRRLATRSVAAGPTDATETSDEPKCTPDLQNTDRR